MTTPENPFAASASEATSPVEAGTPEALKASKGARFLNFLVDYVVQILIGAFVGAASVAIGGEAAAEVLASIPSIILGIGILLLYYLVCELTSARTVGKLVTGTIVVDKNGNPPTAVQIVGRTICRLIPFEALSFLGPMGRGWHDSITETYVVKIRQ